MRYLFITIVLFTFISCESSHEKELVNASFENYKNSILNDKGEESIKYVDKRTLKHYAHILELVKTADSLTLEASTLLDKFFVLAVRHTTEKDLLLKMTGDELFIYAIKNGMVGKESVVDASMGDIEIDNDFAVGEFQSKGKNTGLKLHFYKEAGAWKADLTSLFAFSNVGFKKMITESGLAENECLLQILENAYEKQPTNNLWIPINELK